MCSWIGLGIALAAAGCARAEKVDMIEENVVPGKLTVAVYAHELETHAGRLPVWTFVSKGLWTKGQREIRITVKQEAPEAAADYPRDLLDLYRQVYGLVDQGRSFDVGDVTESERALLGRADFRFVLYTPAQVFDGAPNDAPSLTALIVTSKEAEAAQRLGVLRVMTRQARTHVFRQNFPLYRWRGPGRRLPKLLRLRHCYAVIRRPRGARPGLCRARERWRFRCRG